MCKYVIVCGGCISSVGKGLVASSLALLMKLRGHKVQIMKLDPYYNVDCGTIGPNAHGEAFVLGGSEPIECDTDLGTYERITGIEMCKKNIYTSGTLYKELIEEQEAGKYLGETITVVQHVTQKIRDRIEELGKDNEIVFCEIGGTCADDESSSFYIAARQLKQKYKHDCLIIFVSPILYFENIKEFKTKPLQRSIADLRSYGLNPDILVCRSDRQIPNYIFQKVSQLNFIPEEDIVLAPDVDSIYKIPINFYKSNLDDLLADKLNMGRKSCRIHNYRAIVEKIDSINAVIKIGIVHKYDAADAYSSIKEALVHAGIANDVKIEICWISAEDLEKGNPMPDSIHGVIIPGGFGERAVSGKVKAIRYAREKKIPLLGICLGLQSMVIEVARNICKLENANSVEFDKKTPYPVVSFVEGQEKLTTKSANMRLGAYDCELTKGSLANELYGKRNISERHRHRYEVSSEYIEKMNEKGFRVSGRNPQSNLVEVMELDKELHPFFIGTQFHPEFTSNLLSPSPLFVGLVDAAMNNKEMSQINNQT